MKLAQFFNDAYLLTHDNQSTLSSFSQFQKFATNSLVAEKALSGS